MRLDYDVVICDFCEETLPKGTYVITLARKKRGSPNNTWNRTVHMCERCAEERKILGFMKAENKYVGGVN